MKIFIAIMVILAVAFSGLMLVSCKKEEKKVEEKKAPVEEKKVEEQKAPVQEQPAPETQKKTEGEKKTEEKPTGGK
jgi:outer membrane biosynthesis protein TonB